MLLHQLTYRFGDLPPSAQSRVLVASAREVDTWADAVLEAESAEGVLAATLGN